MVYLSLSICCLKSGLLVFFLCSLLCVSFFLPLRFSSLLKKKIGSPNSRMIQKMTLVAKGYKYHASPNNVSLVRFDAGSFEEGPFYCIYWIEYYNSVSRKKAVVSWPKYQKPYQVIFQQITSLGPGSVEAKGKKWGEKAKSTSEADCTNNCTINW